MVRRMVMVGLGLGLACTAGENTDDGGAFGSSPATTPIPPSDGSGGDGSAGPTSGISASADGDMSSGVGPGTTGDGSSGGPGSMGDTMTGGGMGQQPATGVYSHCLDPMECMGGPTLCITINDPPEDGFCTTVACMDPAADCPPTPGGTAMPVCFMVDVNGSPDMACALDCAGGLTCPTGMTCWNLGASGSICA